MSNDSHANICYGILFDKNFVFPWDSHSDGIEDWFFDVAGLCEDLLVEICYVNFHQDDEPRILAISDSVQSCSSETPTILRTPLVPFDPSVLLNFCKKYDIELQEHQTPQWYLVAQIS